MTNGCSSHPVSGGDCDCDFLCVGAQSECYIVFDGCIDRVAVCMTDEQLLDDKVPPAFILGQWISCTLTGATGHCADSVDLHVEY